MLSNIKVIAFANPNPAHVRAFNTHYAYTERALSSSAKCFQLKLRDLRLHDQNVAELTLSQWQDVLAYN